MPSSQSRHVYTREQRAILEASFACQSHPDLNEKERLASLFNCNLIQISNWFQNHRVSSFVCVRRSTHRTCFVPVFQATYEKHANDEHIVARTAIGLSGLYNIELQLRFVDA
jgi:hypothetical protein